MTELRDLKAEVLAAADALGALSGVRDSEIYQDRLRAARVRLADSRYRVVVCGEFKRGKSTLLNALAGADVFPTGREQTTNVMTLLEWGETATVSVYRDGRTEVVSGDLAALARFVTEQHNLHDRQRIDCVHARAPLPKLRNGVLFVDTPGLGGPDGSYAAATSVVLPDADAVLFVVSAGNVTFSVFDEEVVRDAFRLCRVVIVVVTKVDSSVRPAADLVADVAHQVSLAAGRPRPDVRVLGVSAREYRRARAETPPDEEGIAESGIPELEELLWDRLAGACGTARLLDTLDVLEQISEAERDTIRWEGAASADPGAARSTGEEVTARLQRAKAEREAREAFLREFAARFRAEVRPARTMLSARFDHLGERWINELNVAATVENPTTSAHAAARAMAAAAHEAMRELERITERVAADLVDDDAAAGSEVDTWVGPDSSFQPIVLVPPVPPVRQPSRLSQWRSGSRIGQYSGPWGWSVGSLFGGVVGAAVGAVLGHFLGLVAGAQSVRRAARDGSAQARRRELQARFERQLRMNQRNALENFDTAVDQQLVRLSARLAGPDTRIESLERSAESVAAELAATEAERRERRTALDRRRLAHDDVAGRLAALRRAVSALPGGEGIDAGAVGDEAVGAGRAVGTPAMREPA